MKQLHFISGLPRSGSTLLSGILTQNPNVHAAMSSPVASLINGCLEQIGAGSEFYSFFDEKKRKTICSALVLGVIDGGIYKAEVTIVFNEGTPPPRRPSRP